jgi:hypothetical protein
MTFCAFAERRCNIVAPVVENLSVSEGSTHHGRKPMKQLLLLAAAAAVVVLPPASAVASAADLTEMVHVADGVRDRQAWSLLRNAGSASQQNWENPQTARQHQR